MSTEANLGSPSAPARVALGGILAAGLASTVLALGVAGGALFWLLHTGKLVPNGQRTVYVERAPEPATAERPSHVVALDPIIVNLADDGGRSFLRAGVSLRIEDEPKGKTSKDDAKESKDDKTGGATAALRDDTLAVLSSQRSDALLSAEGKQVLKKRLIEQYSKTAPDTHVLDVYFTDFLVQRG